LERTVKAMIQYGEKEMAYLSQKDEVMKELIRHYGKLEAGHVSDVYQSLVFHIIGQMLSNKVADVMTARFVKLVGKVTPSRVLAKSAEEIRSIGISSRKAEYILQLSQDVQDDKYDFSTLKDKTDDEVIAYLLQIRGVGRWTAEMITEFTLGRINVFSYDDVALQNGMKKAYDFKTLSKKRFERYRKKFSPYCSVASLYFYAVNDDPEWERNSQPGK
jgi:DNA-3-methyladenine glycosylase II